MTNADTVLVERASLADRRVEDGCYLPVPATAVPFGLRGVIKNLLS